MKKMEEKDFFSEYLMLEFMKGLKLYFFINFLILWNVKYENERAFHVVIKNIITFASFAGGFCSAGIGFVAEIELSDYFTSH